MTEPPSPSVAAVARDLDEFVRLHGDRLRRALVGRYGVDAGLDAHAAALAWASEHWSRLALMANPVGYLYRVAQTASRRDRRWQRRLAFPTELPDAAVPAVAPDLFDVLARLPEAQRVSVLLVHAYGWSYAEVAEVLDVSVAAVTNHVHRGMVRLRRLVGDDAATPGPGSTDREGSPR